MFITGELAMSLGCLHHIWNSKQPTNWRAEESNNQKEEAGYDCLCTSRGRGHIYKKYVSLRKTPAAVISSTTAKLGLLRDILTGVARIPF